MSISAQVLIELINGVEDPVLLLGATDDHVVVNEAFRSALGLPADCSFDIDECWPASLTLESLEGDYVSEFELPDGRHVKVSLSGVKLSNESLVIRIRGIHTDDLSLSNYQGQRLETLGILAGGIAHDFNNILAGILGHITYLKTVLPGVGSHTESLQAIEDGARKASGITQQILDFSRLDDGEKPRRVNLGDLAISTCRLLKGALSPEYQIRADISSSDVFVLAVEARLAQVITNLVVNARDASEPDSSIQVNVRVERPGEVLYGLFKTRELSASQFACLEVVDTGCGIESDLIEKVFEPYFTTKADRGGTGLGLSTVSAIVNLLGGALEIDSTPGAGTRVAFYLPVMEPMAEDVGEDGEEDPELTGGNERILIVDDEQPVRNVLMMSLEHLGYEVETAASGMEALEKFKMNGQRGFDLVILDMLMPKLPGDEVFEKLQQLDPEVRVLVISGFSSREAVDKILRNGGLGFIQKPFTIDQLSKKVRECFD